MTLAPSYASQRDHMNDSMATQVPSALMNGFAAAAERMDAIDFAARAPRVGDPAPDFTLPDHNGDEVSLSGLLRDGPVVLIFYRGEWCPYCNLQLRTFQARLEELAEYGAQLVAVSPQTPDHSLSMAARNELRFHVLSDVGAKVIDRYGLRYEVDVETRDLLRAVGNDLVAYNGEVGWTLPAAATLVVSSSGYVRFASVRGDWTERTEPTEVLSVLAEMATREAA
jgi:peroxiredoxin